MSGIMLEVDYLFFYIDAASRLASESCTAVQILKWKFYLLTSHGEMETENQDVQRFRRRKEYDLVQDQEWLGGMEWKRGTKYEIFNFLFIFRLTKIETVLFGNSQDETSFEMLA
jgi:hypothetical protein